MIRQLGVLLFLSVALPAHAQFVTVDAMAFQTSAVATAYNYVYVGNATGPTVLAYDKAIGTYAGEISLVGVATRGVPTGVTSMAVASNGSVIVGTKPFGEIFRIQSLSPTSLGVLAGLPGGDSFTAITAIASRSGQLFFGGRNRIDTFPTAVFRTDNLLAGATLIALAGDTLPRVVRDIDIFDSIVAIGTEDSIVANAAGRLYLFNNTTSVITRVFAGDSAVTAITDRESTILFATAPSGTIRDAFSLASVLAPPETQVNSMLYARNGSDSAVFIASEANTLRILLRNGTNSVPGTPEATLARILDLAFCDTPERVYGIGITNVGTSVLFYYDSVPPQVETVRFSIDTSLVQPRTPDTFFPPLTRGRYTLRFKTSEQLAILPTVTLVYSNGAQQSVAVTTTDSIHFTGEFTVDSTRSSGAVMIRFTGVDRAGNVTTAFITIGTFENREIARAVIANNLFKPGQGEFMTVRYLLFSPQNVSIKIYNMRGQLVEDISPGFRNAGDYQDAIWRGRSRTGGVAASGVYLIRFEAGEFASTLKTMLVR